MNVTVVTQPHCSQSFLSSTVIHSLTVNYGKAFGPLMLKSILHEPLIQQLSESCKCTCSLKMAELKKKQQQHQVDMKCSIWDRAYKHSEAGNDWFLHPHGAEEKTMSSVCPLVERRERYLSKIPLACRRHTRLSSD